MDAAGQLQVVPAAQKDGFSFDRLESGVQFRANGITKNVIFYGPGTVRVNANLGQPYTKQPSLVIVAKPAQMAFTVEESSTSLAIDSKALHIVVDKETGALTFLGADGKELTRERAEKIFCRFVAERLTC